MSTLTHKSYIIACIAFALILIGGVFMAAPAQAASEEEQLKSIAPQVNLLNIVVSTMKMAHPDSYPLVTAATSTLIENQQRTGEVNVHVADIELSTVILADLHKTREAIHTQMTDLRTRVVINQARLTELSRAVDALTGATSTRSVNTAIAKTQMTTLSTEITQWNKMLTNLENQRKDVTTQMTELLTKIKHKQGNLQTEKRKDAIEARTGRATTTPRISPHRASSTRATSTSINRVQAVGISDSAVLKIVDTEKSHDRGLYTVVFEVTAGNKAMYIPHSLGRNNTLKTVGVNYRIQDRAGKLSRGTASTSFTSTADEDSGNNYFIVAASSTEQFTVKLEFDPEVAGSYRLRLPALNWASSAHTPRSRMALLPVSDFSTELLAISEASTTATTTSSAAAFAPTADAALVGAYSDEEITDPILDLVIEIRANLAILSSSVQDSPYASAFSEALGAFTLVSSESEVSDSDDIATSSSKKTFATSTKAHKNFPKDNFGRAIMLCKKITTNDIPEGACKEAVKAAHKELRAAIGNGTNIPDRLTRNQMFMKILKSKVEAYLKEKDGTVKPEVRSNANPGVLGGTASSSSATSTPKTGKIRSEAEVKSRILELRNKLKMFESSLKVQ